MQLAGNTQQPSIFAMGSLGGETRMASRVPFVGSANLSPKYWSIGTRCNQYSNGGRKMNMLETAEKLSTNGLT